MEKEQEGLKLAVSELRREFSVLRDRVVTVENTARSLTDGVKSQGIRLGSVEADTSRLSSEASRLGWQLDQVIAVLAKLEARDEAQAVEIQSVNSWIKGVIMVGTAITFLLTLRGPIVELLKSSAPTLAPADASEGYPVSPADPFLD